MNILNRQSNSADGILFHQHRQCPCSLDRSGDEGLSTSEAQMFARLVDIAFHISAGVALPENEKSLLRARNVERCCCPTLDRSSSPP